MWLVNFPKTLTQNTRIPEALVSVFRHILCRFRFQILFFLFLVYWCFGERRLSISGIPVSPPGPWSGQVSSAALARASGPAHCRGWSCAWWGNTGKCHIRNLPGSRKRSESAKVPCAVSPCRHLDPVPHPHPDCSQARLLLTSGLHLQVPLGKKASEGRWTPSGHFIPQDTTLTLLEEHVSASSSASVENVHLRDGESPPG